MQDQQFTAEQLVLFPRETVFGFSSDARNLEAPSLIRDRVLYRLPMGSLGPWIGGRFVASDVKRIFAYRATKTESLLTAAAQRAR